MEFSGKVSNLLHQHNYIEGEARSWVRGYCAADIALNYAAPTMICSSTIQDKLQCIHQIAAVRFLSPTVIFNTHAQRQGMGVTTTIIADSANLHLLFSDGDWDCESSDLWRGRSVVLSASINNCRLRKTTPLTKVNRWGRKCCELSLDSCHHALSMISGLVRNYGDSYF